MSQFGTAERESFESDLLLWAVGLWVDLIDVVLYDVRVNARECSIRAARDQITHRDVKPYALSYANSILSVYSIVHIAQTTL